ncbi:hypothetical protein AVDCRST_MAG84-1157, partial [uncultured Microcoleus sp.]
MSFRVGRVGSTELLGDAKTGFLDKTAGLKPRSLWKKPDFSM